MNTLYITIIYPDKYPLKLTIRGNITVGNGYYNIVDEDNHSYYFPTALTIITTKQDAI